ncbi:MAG: hypothetical protein JWO52_7516 [Gammaproteobacteria bacterium]|nr:hypothetical protein [Gammaproteobacteria bacterium]
MMAPSSDDLSPLFRPLAVGGLKLPNRIVMAPMSRYFAVNGSLDAEAVAYYRRRAEGGAGLLITEGLAISRTGAQSATIPHFFGERNLAQWRPVVTEVHSVGGKIFAQIWHVGQARFVEPGTDPEDAVGPSARIGQASDDLTYYRGRAMLDADIEQVVREYVTAAWAAQQLGFDGIEIHAAHGYLLDEFMWPRLNLRTDRYGGSIESRVFLAAEVVRAVRAAVGNGFPISYRFSQWKLPEFFAEKLFKTPQELEAFLRPLIDAGVDMFHASTRRYWQPEFPGSELTLAGWTRKLSGRVTIAVGSIGLSGALQTSMATVGETSESVMNLQPLADMIARDEIDLGAVGRAMLANADWADIVRNGNYSRLIPYSAGLLQSRN